MNEIFKQAALEMGVENFLQRKLEIMGYSPKIVRNKDQVVVALQTLAINDQLFLALSNARKDFKVSVTITPLDGMLFVSIVV